MHVCSLKSISHLGSQLESLLLFTYCRKNSVDSEKTKWRVHPSFILMREKGFLEGCLFFIFYFGGRGNFHCR